MSAIIPWRDLAEVYGFIGNSLLRPMTQTARVGVDPDFWDAFPSFGDPAIRDAVMECARHADRASALKNDGGDPVEAASVEYTRLFVGPPSPAAPPWETMYRSKSATVGFGEPTFEMRRILREAGLELSNENRQYEDHMGIEILYLSTRCAAIGEATEDAEVEGADEQAALGFIEDHPLAWIGSLRERVVNTHPDGYFAALLALAEAVLSWHAGLVRE